MIKRKPDTIIKFTVDELATIKKIAEFDCEGVKCSECECAYNNHMDISCFKGDCRMLLNQLDDYRR